MPMDPDNNITSLISSAHERADDVLRRLAPRTSDRLEPMALEWLRRWSPKPMLLVPADCGCARGRCALCN